jgi:acetylornithine deacetylase/succinyl-diaminopimelate desuccinylase-like protein
MTVYKTPLSLTEKLIALPSYVDSNNNEGAALDFLFDYLSTTFPDMKVEKQFLKNSSRYNLVLRGKNSPKLFVLGHIDTVQPKEGWRTDPFSPVIQNGNLYGLGSCDMKGSLAAFLWSLAEEKKRISLDDVTLLIYVDEEYDFQGIRRFVQNEPMTKLTPKLALSLDGELPVGTGCRGVIELTATVTGKSGHAGDPTNGINAITESMAALADIRQKLEDFSDPALGKTTVNVAAIRGGVRQQDNDGTVYWLEEGNVIPDAVQFVFEVRPSVIAVNAGYVKTMLIELLEQRGLKLVEVHTRHDISPWPVVHDAWSINLLKTIYAEAKVPFEFSDRSLKGYIDAQMVAEKISAPTYIIGTGGMNKHGVNENVSINNIEAAARIYRGLLQELLP